MRIYTFMVLITIVVFQLHVNLHGRRKHIHQDRYSHGWWGE